MVLTRTARALFHCRCSVHSVLFECHVQAKLPEEWPPYSPRMFGPLSFLHTLTDVRFNLPKIGAREAPLSRPAEPQIIPGAVSITQSIGSDAGTAAAGVASEAGSAISSAITSIETIISSPPPKNCSLGVKYACVGFDDHLDCFALPLNISSVMPSPVSAIENFSSVKELDQKLARVSTKSVRACFTVGAVFAAMAMQLGICSVAQRLGYISSPSISRLSTHLSAVCSVICAVPIIVLTAILYGIRLKAETPMEIVLAIGEASKQILAALVYAVLMDISILAGWYLGRIMGDES